MAGADVTDELTAERLRELLHYDAPTGLFSWRMNRGLAKAGVPRTLRRSRYLQIRVDRRVYYAHRLAWLYVYGAWPKNQIDHINGAPDDNRIENLRDVPELLNRQNLREAIKTSRSGLLGAVPTINGSFQSIIRVDGKSVFLGVFKTATEAHAAYLDAKRKLHPGCTI